MVTLTAPPLRERREDIVPLAEQFMARFAVALRKPVRTIGESAQAILRRYPFPGNVRELSNLIERALLFSSGHSLEATHFPADVQAGDSAIARSNPGHMPASLMPADPDTVQLTFRVGDQSLSDLEDQIIAEVLQRSDGNKTLAAKHLGINRWMLDRRRKS